jgi:hypothetical protein
MDKEQAKTAWRNLVARYGIRWTADVPASAWKDLREIDAALSVEEKRAVLQSDPRLLVGKDTKR